MMQRHALLNLVGTLMYVALFVTVILIIGTLKWDSLASGGLILDDMQRFYPSIFTDYSYTTYASVYSAINSTLYQPSLVRFTYLGVIGLVSVLTYALLLNLTSEKLPAYLIALLASLAPTSTITILFINGTYNALFLVPYLLGVIGLIRFFKNHNGVALPVQAGLFFLSAIAIGISVELTTNGLLLPLAVTLLPWWRSQLFLKSRRQFAIYGVVYLGIAGFFITNRALAMFGHPYAGMEGRLSFDFETLWVHAVELVANVFNSYFINYLNTGTLYNLEVASPGFYVVIILSSLVGAGAILAVFSQWFREVLLARSSYLLAALFVSFAIVLAVGPLAPNTRLHLWHYYLPAYGIAILIAIVLRSFLPKILFFAGVLGLIGLSILRISEQVVFYDRTFTSQDVLAENIRRVSPSWPVGSTIIIETDYIPFLSGFGQLGGQRDLGFLKFQSTRHDIKKAAIATPSKVRAIMQGYAIAGPIKLYRYSFGDGEFGELETLLFDNGEALRAYNTSGPKPILLMSGAHQDVRQYLKDNSVQLHNYLYLRSGKINTGVQYTGESTKFDGDKFVSRQFEVPDETSILTYEFVLKSDFETCVDNTDKQQRCPSMPFLSSPFALYQPAPSKLMLQIKTSAGDKYVHFDIDQERWQKIRLLIDTKNNAVTVFHNDQLYEMVSDASLNLVGTRSLAIGKGYRQRFWTGHIGYFVVTSDSSAEPETLLEVFSSERKK
ncbi:MAG: hypothetical protein GKR90_20645 [Pseudomonadales bacterium]|nr:hypothetical protein [Pseudomonadales bacterium]